MSTRTSVAPRAVSAGPTLLGVPVLLPKLADPRLRVAAVVVTLQVLGQTVLGFKLSVAQILITILACAVVEIALTYRSAKVLAWPASALLTGNGVALLLRSAGTRHGDWWALNGVGWFLLAAVGGLLSKHLYRPAGAHVFNPANLGLVVVLAVVGSPYVFPQYLFWGSFGSPPVVASLAVIAIGAAVVLRPLGLLPALGSYLAVFGVGVGVLAARGNCLLAVWQTGPVCGGTFWLNVALSPEVLVFACYMITDPKTIPAGAVPRLLFGAGTAALALGLVSTQSTEYGVKFAILSSLALACASTPLLALLRRRTTLSRSVPLDAVVLVALLAVVLTGLWRVQHDTALLDLERGIVSVGGVSQ